MKLDPNKSSSTSPPRKIRRAFTGLAGSPLARYARPLESLVTRPILFDPASLHEGHTIGLPVLDRSAIRKLHAKVRAAEWRSAHNSAAFKSKRAKVVQQKRLIEKNENERAAAIGAIVQANPVPLFVMRDAPHGLGLLVTGGYDSEHAAEVADTRQQAEGRRISGKGYGSLDSETELVDEYDDSFVERQFMRFAQPRNVKLLHQFIYEVTFTNKANALACGNCKKEISPKLSKQDDTEFTFLHILHFHPDLFQKWVERLNGKTKCLEDHARMITRYSGGPHSLVCARCGKTIWKALPLRTHTSDEPEEGDPDGL